MRGPTLIDARTERVQTAVLKENAADGAPAGATCPQGTCTFKEGCACWRATPLSFL